MKDKINARLGYLEADIENAKGRLEAKVKEFRTRAANADSFYIVNHLPGYIEQIAYERNRIEKMEEQHRMLVWLLNEE